MRHRFFIGIDPLKCKKQINMLSASYLTFRRANLSLMGCTSAEPISVSVRSKVQRIKLYLQTVEIPNHFHGGFGAGFGLSPVGRSHRQGACRLCGGS